MDNFSSYDALKAAMHGCLPCFALGRQDGGGLHSQHGEDRYEDLDALLVDSREASDVDAETMSLHSNPGTGSRGSSTRRRRRGGRKDWWSWSSWGGMRMFGWGRQAIRLDESDDEDGDEENARVRGRRKQKPDGIQAPPLSAGASSSTFDSDAAPLDASIISQLAAQQSPRKQDSPADARPAVTDDADDEERRKKEKAARRAERRARREEQRRISELNRRIGLDDTEFEGFQGSGSVFGPSPTSNSLRTSKSSRSSASSSTFSTSVVSKSKNRDGTEQRIRPSRSRSSNSQPTTPSGQELQFNHHCISQQPHPQSPLSPTAQGVDDDETPKKKKSKSHRKTDSKSTGASSSKSKKSSSSTGSTHDSTSLASPPPLPRLERDLRVMSPTNAGFHFFDARAAIEVDADDHDSTPTMSPRKGHQVDQAYASAPATPPPPPAAEGFPSVGFGRAGGGGAWAGRARSEVGVFLARRGDGDE